MAKLKYPLMSQRAAGVLGKTLQFTSWRGRAVAGRRRRPKQPRTLAQRATRLWMGWFAKQWSELTDPEQATWQNTAAADDISAYNAFIRGNIQHVRNQDDSLYGVDQHTFWPSAAFPRTADTPTCLLSNVSMTNQVLQSTHRINITSAEDGWCLLWYLAGSTAIGVKYSKLVRILEMPGTGIIDVVIPNLPAGPSWITYGSCSRTGTPRNNFRQKSINPLPS